MIETILAVNQGLKNRFPTGFDPFMIMTRLMEEGGELAQQVNLFEDRGTKREKMGEPKKSALADEVKGVLLAAFQIAEYYDAMPELEQSLESMRQRLKDDGFLE